MLRGVVAMERVIGCRSGGCLLKCYSPFGQAGEVGEDYARVRGQLVGLIFDAEVSCQDLSGSAGVDQETGRQLVNSPRLRILTAANFDDPAVVGCQS